MKRSKVIKLVLVAALFGSCSNHDKEDYSDNDPDQVWYRGDSEETYQHGTYGTFYPFWIYNQYGYFNSYRSNGYSSVGRTGDLSHPSGVTVEGHSISRSGFGSSARGWGGG